MATINTAKAKPATTKQPSLAAEKKAEKSIGALWFKTSKNGVEYFTGDIELNGELIRIKAFKNSYKETDNHPDWKIYIREPLENQSNP